MFFIFDPLGGWLRSGWSDPELPGFARHKDCPSRHPRPSPNFHDYSAISTKPRSKQLQHRWESTRRRCQPWIWWLSNGKTCGVQRPNWIYSEIPWDPWDRRFLNLLPPAIRTGWSGKPQIGRFGVINGGPPLVQAVTQPTCGSKGSWISVEIRAFRDTRNLAAHLRLGKFAKKVPTGSSPAAMLWGLRMSKWILSLMRAHLVWFPVFGAKDSMMAAMKNHCLVLGTSLPGPQHFKHGPNGDKMRRTQLEWTLACSTIAGTEPAEIIYWTVAE